MYHGDRFTSLLLGLPYGFNDAHYGSTLETIAHKLESLQHCFVVRCAFIAGKIIDRNAMSTKPSFANAMDLDEKMDAIATSMSGDWWDMPAELPGPSAELEQLRERLLQQFYFFHVRTYIHMPFIVQSPTKSPYEHSRLACMEASRQMLRRYVLLRAEVQGTCLFECKTSDFVGFMAAVVLLLGLSNQKSILKPRTPDQDLHLIASMERILRKEESAKRCKIAAQCRKTLEMLSGIQHNDFGNVNHSAETQKILIPYFGTVVRKPRKRASMQSLSSDIVRSSNEASYSPSLLLASNISPTSDEQISLADTHIIEYEGYNPPSSIQGDMHLEADNLRNFPTEDRSPWLDTLMTDLDQDWSMFLET